EIEGLATRSAETRAAHVERRRGLPVAEVGHDCGQIGPGDDVKQLLLVDRKPGPDCSQIVDRVDVRDDGVMARPCVHGATTELTLAGGTEGSNHSPSTSESTADPNGSTGASYPATASAQ